MTGKEVQAVERLNRMLIAESTTNNIGTRVYISDLRCALELIQKQQKEIKKLKGEKIYTLEEMKRIEKEDMGYDR